jgi:hypothetical protein
MDEETGIKNSIEKRRKKRLKSKAINILNKGIQIKNKFIKKDLIKKARNPGIDLLRLLTMYCIVLNHFLYHGQGINHFYRYKTELLMIHSYTDWHNDAFILISGIVGYKTNKYSNLLYLWLQVAFYSVGIHKYATEYKKGFHVRQDIEKQYYPLIFSQYWYFTIYFGTYLYLPLINKGIEYLTKFELRLVIMSSLGILILWRDYKNRNDMFNFHGGGSIPWFLLFYTIGGYIGKYKVNYNGFKRLILLFIYGSIYLIASHVYFKACIKKEYDFIIFDKKIEIPFEIRKMLNESYDSSLKIIQSISVCLFFLNIPYNKYIGKVICFFGPLAFGIYLIHDNNIIRENFVRKLFIYESRNISCNYVLRIILTKALKVSLICLLIDYLRHLLFNILRIKKILIFIETKIKEKFN